MIAHAPDPSTQRTKQENYQFEAILGYAMKLCLQNKDKKKKTNKTKNKHQVYRTLA